MDLIKRIEEANQSGKLILLVFYTDCSPHYEWIESVIHEFESPVNIIRINMETQKTVADKFEINIAPSFILLEKDIVRWEKIGILFPGELKDVIEMFKRR